MTIRYAPMERHSAGLAPTMGMLRYQTDDECDLDRALALGMTDDEYLSVTETETDWAEYCCMENPCPTRPNCGH